MQMFCVKINLNDYTMSVPLQILNPLAADFDGFTYINIRNKVYLYLMRRCH